MNDDNDGQSGEGDDANPAETLKQLSALREQHKRLDEEITALQQNGVTDMLKLARMKKMKLALKDRIHVLEDKLTPDIIA